MKTTLAIVTLSVAAAYSSFAQGEVLFANGNHEQISANSDVGGPTTGVLTFSSEISVYYYALYYSVAVTSVAGSGSIAVIPTSPSSPGSYAFSDSNWTFDAYASSTTSAGKFTALTPDSNGATPVPGVPIGSSAQFVIVGWSGNIGSTINSVENWLAGNEGYMPGWIGESAVSGAISTGSAAPGSQTFPLELVNGSAPGLSAFTLGEYGILGGEGPPPTTPEPTTLAMGLMGAASLLALRRKKA